MVSVCVSDTSVMCLSLVNWGPINIGCFPLPFTRCNDSPPVGVSSVRSMLPQTRVVKTLGCLLCIRGISDLPTDSIVYIRNAVSIGWVTACDILRSRWFSTCRNSTLPDNDYTTNCSKICFGGSCFPWDTALSKSWPIEFMRHSVSKLGTESTWRPANKKFKKCPSVTWIELSDLLILPKLRGLSEHIYWERITVRNTKAAFRNVVIWSEFLDCEMLSSISILLISHTSFLTVYSIRMVSSQETITTGPCNSVSSFHIYYLSRVSCSGSELIRLWNLEAHGGQIKSFCM